MKNTYKQKLLRIRFYIEICHRIAKKSFRNQLKKSFFLKKLNKKYENSFESLISDLKSARKNTKETVFPQTRMFQKILCIEKLHCAAIHVWVINKQHTKQQQLII